MQHYRQSPESYVSRAVVFTIATIAVISGLFLNTTYAIANQDLMILINLFMIFSFIWVLLELARKKYDRARKLVLLCGLFWTIFIQFVLPKEAMAELFFYALAVGPFIICPRSEWKFALIICLVSIVTFMALQFFDRHGIVQIPEDDLKNIAFVFTLTTFAVIVFPLAIMISLRRFMTRLLSFETHRTAQRHKLKGLGEVAAGIAHEIANPLAILAGRISMISNLQSNGQLTLDDWQKCRASIDSQIGRIESISRALTDLNLQITEKAPNDLIQLVNETVAELANYLTEKGISIELDYDPNQTFIVECNALLIKRCFLNLFENSFNAFAADQPKNIWVKFVRLEKFVNISVIDNGTGISPDIAKDIFRPFFTTKMSPNGTGLGLSLTYKIIHEHKGRIYLDSKSQNTTFVILLPNENYFRK